MKTNILYSGRSMIEMLGVLAIMGIITGMSIAAYNMAMGTLKSGRTTEDITRIQQSVRSLYTEGTYDGIKTDTFISLGVVPAMPGATNKARNQYGGEYIITADDGGLSFVIEVTEVSKTDCVTFVTKQQPGVVSIDVNGQKEDLSGGKLTAAALTDNCVGRDTSNVKFKFK